MFFKRPAGVEWLAVFLGNPGPQYAMTRHNAGFLTADAFEKQQGMKINRSHFKALTGTCEINGKKVLAMKPQTYMNLSGESVYQAASFYKIPPEKVIVVSDEMSLPLGRIRVRAKGSAGGHNGLKNIILKLGSEDFPRIRLGVGAPPNPDYDMKDWALSSFKDEDKKVMLESAGKAAQAVAFYIDNGIEKTMNEFNG